MKKKNKKRESEIALNTTHKGETYSLTTEWTDSICLTKKQKMYILEILNEQKDRLQSIINVFEGG